LHYLYATVEGVSEPKYELAPEPAGLSFSCLGKLEKAEKLESGCRALEFRYSSATTAKGENETEWGEYKGRLNEVVLVAYNPSTKAMGETALAEYAYDKQGRLRKEWNPQISPDALPTTYAYNSENQVVAVAGPDQQPWLMHYGTLANVAEGGWLLSVIRPAASATMVGTGLPPANTKAPTLSTTSPKVGEKISVSGDGSWSHSPPTYTFQWEYCNTSGKECEPIAGEVNESYYPREVEKGHTLVALVTAMNKSGVATAATAASGVVAAGTVNTPLPEPPSVGTNAVSTVEYQLGPQQQGLPEMTAGAVEKWGQKAEEAPVEGAAIFPPDKPMGWPAKEYTRATVRYLDSKGRTVNVLLPTGGVSTTEYNSLNDVVRTLGPDNRAKALAAGCESKEACRSSEVADSLDSESTYEEGGSEPGTRLLSTRGPAHMVKLADGEKHADEEKEARDYTSYHYDQGAPTEGGPYNLVTERVEEAQVVSGLPKTPHGGGEEAGFDARTTTMSYSGQNNLGWTLREPTSVTTDPAGLDLTHTTEYEASTGKVTETKMPAVAGSEYSYATTAGGARNRGKVTAVVADSNGNVWVSEPEDDRVEELNSDGVEVKSFGSKEEGEPVDVAVGPHNSIWVLESSTECKIIKYSESGEKLATITGAHGSGNGQCSSPSAIAVDRHGNIWVADTGNSRIEQLNAKGEYLKIVGTKGTGAGQLEQPTSIAVDPHGDIIVGDYKNERVEEYNEKGEKGEYLREFGSTKELPLGHPLGLAFDPYGNIIVLSSNNRGEEFSPEGVYQRKFGQAGSGEGEFEFGDPSGIAMLPNANIWIGDGKALQKWRSPGTATGDAAAHDTRTVYYTVAANSEHKECGGHSEYAGLPCLSAPVAQPGTSGLPNLPETSYSSYNLYDEPTKSVETVGSNTRTSENTYDAAGRLIESAIPSTVGTALPPVTDEYNETSGLLAQQRTTAEGKTNRLKSVYNTLGQLTSYTDAAGTTSTYEYDVDGRVSKANDGKGTQTFTYNTSSGLLSELVDSSAANMKFTATYDEEGNQRTETYPNGMTATNTYNATGSPVKREYVKTTHCSEKCAWFTDSVMPSIHGETLSQTSSLSSQEYLYDAAGRLLQVQNTPAGKGCTTRDYVYDEDTNRTSLTTYEPNTGGECATESGTVETHAYDTADRLTDTGTKYSELGDITALPSSDAGGAELASNYYGDGQVQNQTQKEQTVGFNLDPDRRPYETISTGKPIVESVTSHYAGPGSEPSWTTNLTGETKRDIHGISGALVATQAGTEAPVLQLSNLHGDLIATAYTSETATELASKQDTSEYGVPTNSLPAKYSWLGSLELPTELPSGVTEMGARSYVPQLGRFLQPDPAPGGSANSYSYTFGNPVNTSDPTGAYTSTDQGWTAEYLGGRSANVAAEVRAAEEAQRAAEEARHAAEEAAAREAAQSAASEAAEAAAAAAGPGYAGEEEWEEWEEWGEWGEEEGGYEWASYRKSGENGTEEAHVEPAVLYQPLGEGGGAENGGERSGASAGPPSSAFGTHSHYYHRYKSDYRGPSTWEQFVCGVTPLVKLMAEQSNVGNAIVHESRPRCG
jgi:RHS repeat-associated protein